MNNYSFCKKNGEIKKSFKFVCQYISSAKMEHRTVTNNRGKTIVDEYNCYVIPRIELCSGKKYDYIMKVSEVCHEFNVKIKVWYSCNETTIELLGDKVPYMIEILDNLLGGDTHIR